MNSKILKSNPTPTSTFYVSVQATPASFPLSNRPTGDLSPSCTANSIRKVYSRSIFVLPIHLSLGGINSITIT